MRACLFAQMLVASVAFIVSLQGVSAAPMRPTAYLPCNTDGKQYPDAARGIEMRPDDVIPQQGKTKKDVAFMQWWRYGLATAQTFYFPYKSPHAIVVLESHGVAPAYHLKTSSGFGRLYTIPDGKKHCLVEDTAPNRVIEVDVYTKGTKPSS